VRSNRDQNSALVPPATAPGDFAGTLPATPFAAIVKGTNAGQIDFIEYCADFRIAAPANAVEFSQLAGE
jgi:hypothetical protein